ncbi:phosphatase PAP2 family protein [Aestuariispira ectoiniformans]|uniref:phosphatase PAP2 family protein n=1 Tax=Aestuariispira ectoiniformans TaxID=2775080 RepID=UPI00223C51BB|nr:phosphatase PAP2 family protein [Aestuariispira ectoiniformans]
MYDFDVAVTKAINGLAGGSATMDTLMIWVSAIAVEVLVLAVAGQWWVRNGRSHTRHILVATGFSFLLGLALNQLILLFLHRVRPYDAGITDLLISPSTDYSFPSDHATASFAIGVAFLLHGFRRRGLIFLAAAALVAYSRVHIGIHYFGDVVGGAVTGMLGALLVRAFYREGSRLDSLLVRIL